MLLEFGFLYGDDVDVVFLGCVFKFSGFICYTVDV